MANNVSGIGDINVIVGKIMDVEKLKLARLDKSKAQLEYKMASYENFKGLMKKFTSAVDHLSDIFKNTSWKVSSSDNTVVSTLLSGKNAAPGTHQIDVTQLAQAQRVSGAIFTEKNTALNLTGALNVQIGSDIMGININPGETLETIRDGINNAISNPGVIASILESTAVDNSPEYRLILTSKDTGLANQMTISGDGATLLDLTHELTAAQDAQFVFDGYNVTRSSNTVTDYLDGITFTLNAAGQSATLSISEDIESRNESIKTAISSFVESYNSLIETIDKNQATKDIHDDTYSLIKLRLGQTMDQTIGSLSIKRMLDLGIKKAPSEKRLSEDIDPTTKKNVAYVTIGKLQIDDKALSKAINTNAEDLKTFLADNTNGFIKTMSTTLNEITRSGGSISNREKIITRQEVTMERRIDKEEFRLEELEERLYKKFSLLNDFVERQQKISQYLEQQIDALTYVYKK